MEKETLISEITQRIGETPLSPRTIEEYAGQILPTVPTEGEIPDSFWDMHKGILTTMAGQLRADNKAAVTKFQEDWAKSHPAQTPPPQQTPPPASAPGNGWEEKFQKMLEEQNKKADERFTNLQKQYDDNLSKFKDLQDRYDREQKAAKDAATKAAITSEIAKLGTVNNRILEIALSQVELKDGETIENLTTATKAAYEKEYKAIYGDGAQPYKGNSAADHNDTAVNQWIEQQKKDAEKAEEKRKAQQALLR